MTPTLSMPFTNRESQEIAAEVEIYDPMVIGENPLLLSVAGLTRNLDNELVLDLEVGDRFGLSEAMSELVEDFRRRKIRVSGDAVPLVGGTGETLADLVDGTEWDGGKFADGSATDGSALQGEIHGSKIEDGSIPETKYGDESVSKRALAECSVGEDELCAGAVTTPKIPDDNVTRPKLPPDVQALFDGYVRPTSTSLFFRAEGENGELMTVEPGGTILDFKPVRRTGNIATGPFGIPFPEFEIDPNWIVIPEQWYSTLWSDVSTNEITADGYLKITPKASQFNNDDLLESNPYPFMGAYSGAPGYVKFQLIKKLDPDRYYANFSSQIQATISVSFHVRQLRRWPSVEFVDGDPLEDRPGLSGLTWDIGLIEQPEGDLERRGNLGISSVITAPGYWTETLCFFDRGFRQISAENASYPSEAGVWVMLNCNLLMEAGVTCLEIGEIEARMCGLFPDEEYTTMQSPA